MFFTMYYNTIAYHNSKIVTYHQGPFSPTVTFRPPSARSPSYQAEKKATDPSGCVVWRRLRAVICFQYIYALGLHIYIYIYVCIHTLLYIVCMYIRAHYIRTYVHMCKHVIIYVGLGLF